MRRVSPVMRLALALALLLAAPAGAQAAWTGQDLSGSHTFVDDPAVIVSADGGALASWRFQDGAGHLGRAGAAGATRAPGAAAFGTRVGLVRARENRRPQATVVGLEPDGTKGALLARLLPGPGDTPSGRLAVRFGSTHGRFGRLRTIRRAAPFSIPRVSL